MNRSTNIAPVSLSSSYLMGSPFIGISMMTLKSFGRSRPDGTRSRFILFLAVESMTKLKTLVVEPLIKCSERAAVESRSGVYEWYIEHRRLNCSPRSNLIRDSVKTTERATEFRPRNGRTLASSTQKTEPMIGPHSCFYGSIIPQHAQLT